MEHRLKYRGASLGYTFDDDDNIIETLMLDRQGCGCCSEKVSIPANIKEAIADAENWLAFLRNLERAEEQRQGDV